MNLTLNSDNPAEIRCDLFKDGVQGFDLCGRDVVKTFVANAVNLIERLGAQIITLFGQADFGHAPVRGAHAGLNQTIDDHALNDLCGGVEFEGGKIRNLGDRHVVLLVQRDQNAPAWRIDTQGLSLIHISEPTRRS